MIKLPQVRPALAGASIFITLVPTLVFAQTTDAAAQYDSFMSLFSATAASWEGILRGYASNIFWLLALIELFIVFIPMAFKGADVGEILAELVRYILIIGFFWLLLTQGSAWAGAIIQSMRDAGAAAGGAPVGLSPADVISTGFEIGIQITEGLSIFSPGVSFAFVAAWVVLVLAFGYIAAMIAVALIESYIIIYGAVIFLGLGGLRFTRDYSITVLRYALAVGAKLFVLTLIVNLMQGAFNAWSQYWDDTLTAATSLMGLAITAALITKMIPDLVTSMITGQTSSSGPVGSMATTALTAIAAGAAAAATAGAGQAVAAGASGPGGLANAMQQGLSPRPGLSPGLGLSSTPSPLSAPTAASNGGRAAPSMGEGAGSNSKASVSTGGSTAGPSGGASDDAATMGAFIEDSMSELDAMEAVEADETSSAASRESRPAIASPAATSGPETPASSPPSRSAGVGGRPSSIANAMLKSTGTMAELTVPGMEGSSAVGVAPAGSFGPQVDLGNDDATLSAAAQDQPAMVIEPSDPEPYRRTRTFKAGPPAQFSAFDQTDPTPPKGPGKA